MLAVLGVNATLHEDVYIAYIEPILGSMLLMSWQSHITEIHAFLAKYICLE